MKNNKLFSIILALLVCLTVAVSASAATNDLTFALEPSSSVGSLNGAAVAKGEEFTVAVTIESNPGFLAAVVDVKFDTAKLELVKVEGKMENLTSRVESGDIKLTLGNSKLALTNPEACTPISAENCEVAVLTFKAIADINDQTIITLETSKKKVIDLDGTQTIIPEAGDLKVDIVAAHEHNFVTDEAKDPTCKDTGLTEGKHCSICGFVSVKQEVLPKAEHKYSVHEKAEEATCEKEGKTDGYKCEYCGEWENEPTSIPALGHEFTEYVDVKTPATCENKGWTTYKCFRCDKTEDRQDIDLIDCDFELIYHIDATCSAEGEDWYECIVCHHNKVVKLAKVAHTIVIDEAVAANCTKTGLTEGKHCSECGYVEVAQTEVPALGHEFKNYASDNNATCTANGTETAKCENCTATDTREIENSKIAHDLKEVSKIDAKCGKEGYVTYKCANCDYTEVKTVEALGDHTWGAGSIQTMPTCGKDGVTVYTCIICGETKTDNNVPATGAHVYGEWKVTTEATTEAEGVETRNCLYCDAAETRSIDMLPKDYTVVIVISIVVVVLAGAGVAAYFVLKNKKK